ncbi:hypothetical protein CK203_045099 [Vitis vinifera]|uniref:Uncharacterized protein n=1 Tax=Vitis vinifera TaxID=29760 RepID=A0A438HD54_VITVI|nr:hypothetical protein CK203_045099 [Vitis vinifera]
MFGVRKEENSGDSSQLVSMPPLQASPHGIVKLEYLINTTKTPKEDDPGFKIWDSKNSMIMA